MGCRFHDWCLPKHIPISSTVVEQVFFQRSVSHYRSKVVSLGLSLSFLVTVSSVDVVVTAEIRCIVPPSSRFTIDLKSR